jgi:hypothetical protein
MDIHRLYSKTFHLNPNFETQKSIKTQSLELLKVNQYLHSVKNKLRFFFRLVYLHFKSSYPMIQDQIMSLKKKILALDCKPSDQKIASSSIRL